MIPVKLNIRNFLSYRENVPALDFTGLHVACLCGDNGHGKSALLDAITWCLWGQARGQVQDDLVSYGADEARVELDFEARDGRFRVIRSRRRAGGRRRQGATDLQLATLADDGSPMEVVSGNSVRETQAKIEQQVGMDYETFINSAFLLQGRADEFTSKTPADRKAVLASILGLDSYDRFQARARERVAGKRSETDRLSGSLQQMQSDLAAIGDPESDLKTVNGDVSRLEAELTVGRKRSEELRTKVTALRLLESDLAGLRDRYSRGTEEAARVDSTIASIKERIAEHQKLIARKDDIDAGVRQLQAAQLRFDELEASRQQYDSLMHRQTGLERTIEIEKTRLEAETAQLNRRILEELTPLAGSEAAIAAELKEVRGKQAELESNSVRLADMRAELQRLATAIGEAQTLADSYQAEGEQIRDKLRFLANSDPSSVVCPLCLSPLSEDGCQRLAQNYEAEIEEKRELYRVNQRELRHLETQKKELESDLAAGEQQLAANSNRLQGAAARAEAQLQAAQAAQVELTAAESRLRDQAATLKQDGYCQAERAELVALKEEIAALGYEEEAYRQSLEQVRKLEPINTLKVRLDTALAQLPQEELAHRQNAEFLERIKAEQVDVSQQIAEAESAISGKAEVEANLETESMAIRALESNLQAAIAARGMLESQLERRRNLEREVEQGAVRLAQNQEEQGIFQELVGAFGRQGIQAMLIETVVPRLEEEANALLGRMTDNRMHVKLETQRERRSGSGEPIETLEINVSDELGTRNYEMYSGGEAFRVNLALRIALSRVLSQRTGAPLPTLFIDEGFGTQDASGRERILDVISAIEDDFDKIIVITHLDDLKDMFPVRIEVQKDAGGSTFWLS